MPTFEDDFIIDFEKQKRAPEKIDLVAFFVYKKEAFTAGNRVCIRCINNGIYIEDENTRHHAEGSGSSYALTALDLGCSARKAVEMAARRDVRTGGKISVLDINAMSWR